MLPAWITPNSLLEKHIQPLGCHQPTGGIPLVTSCAQPDAQGHPPAQRPWHGRRTNSFVTERRQGQATHISWRAHPAGWGRSCHGQNRALPCSKGSRMRPLALPWSRCGSAAFSLSSLLAISCPTHPTGFWIIQPYLQPVTHVDSCHQHQLVGAEWQCFTHHSEVFQCIKGPQDQPARALACAETRVTKSSP